MRIVIAVERTLNGFRLTIPDKGREFFRSDGFWTRKIAAEALDLLENVYGFERTAVRFRHL